MQPPGWTYQLKTEARSSAWTRCECQQCLVQGLLGIASEDGALSMCSPGSPQYWPSPSKMVMMPAENLLDSPGEDGGLEHVCVAIDGHACASFKFEREAVLWTLPNGTL